MDIHYEQQDTNVASFKITIKEADYQKDFTKKLRNFAQNANMKGFRPGKVPPGLIKKMYGDQILAEHIQDILQKEISHYFEKNDIDPILSPMPIEEQPIDWKRDKDFEFKFKVANTPDYEIPLDSYDLVKYQVEISSEEVNKTIDDLLEKAAEFEPTEDAISEEDIENFLIGLELEEEEVKEENSSEESEENEEEDDDAKQIRFLGKDIDAAHYSVFVGKKKGDVLSIENPKAFFENIEYHNSGKILGPESIETPRNYVITALDKKEKAVLDKDFFAKVFPDKEIETEETFREQVLETLQNNYKETSENHYRNDLVKKIFAEDIAMELPEEYIKEWLEYQRTNDEEAANQPFEESFQNLIKELRNEILFTKGRKDSEAKVEAEEVRTQLRSMVGQQFGMGQMPMNEQMDNLLDTVVDNLLKGDDQQFVQQAIQEIMFAKIIDYWASKTNPKIETVSKADFEELISKEETAQNEDGSVDYEEVSSSEESAEKNV